MRLLNKLLPRHSRSLLAVGGRTRTWFLLRHSRRSPASLAQHTVNIPAYLFASSSSAVSGNLFHDQLPLYLSSQCASVSGLLATHPNRCNNLNHCIFFKASTLRENSELIVNHRLDGTMKAYFTSSIALTVQAMQAIEVALGRHHIHGPMSECLP